MRWQATRNRVRPVLRGERLRKQANHSKMQGSGDFTDTSVATWKRVGHLFIAAAGGCALNGQELENLASRR